MGQKHTHTLLMMLEENQIVEQSSFVCFRVAREENIIRKHHPKDEKDDQSETTPTSVYQVEDLSTGWWVFFHPSPDPALTNRVPDQLLRPAWMGYCVKINYRV
jgi:hypothetical protein